MSRKSKSLWTQSTNQDLAKAVKNFNAKISRLEKKNPELKNHLPEKVKVSEIKKLIENKFDLKRELNSLRKFSERGSEQLVNVRGSEYNNKITKWQREDMNNRKNLINAKRKRRKEELSKLEVKSRGEGLGYTLGESGIGMGKAEQVQLEPIKAFTPKQTMFDLKKKHKTLRNESQSTYWQKSDIRLRENFIKSLEDNYSQNDIKEITDAINSMDLKEFKKIYYEEDQDFTLNYHNDSNEYQKNLNALRSIFIPNKYPNAKKPKPGSLNPKKHGKGYGKNISKTKK